MTDFFRKVYRRQKWAVILDWLADEKKFEGWDAPSKSRFTRAFK